MSAFAPNGSVVDKAPALSASRSRVLAVLQEDGGPLAVSEVARRTGLHPNTARFHLDGLVEDAFAAREAEQRARPGRPRTLYHARPDGERAGQRNYRLLAEILTSCLADEVENPARVARQAGRAWGRHFAELPKRSRGVGVNEAIRQVDQMLDQLGFAPEATTGGGERRILLHHCPFRETAEEHQDIVCGIHLGLMQGLLGEIDAPVEAERLDPFVGPSLCVAGLGSRRRRKNSADTGSVR